MVENHTKLTSKYLMWRISLFLVEKNVKKWELPLFMVQLKQTRKRFHPLPKMITQVWWNSPLTMMIVMRSCLIMTIKLYVDIILLYLFYVHSNDCVRYYKCKCIYVTGIEIRLWNLWDGSCMAVEEDGLGMPADVQGSQQVYCTCMKVFPT